MISLRACLSIAMCASFTLAGFGASKHSFEAQAQVELPEASWSAGDVVHADYRSNSALHTLVLVDGKLLQEFDSIEEKNGAKILRVLAVDERGPTRVRIEYGTLRSVQQRVDMPAASADDEPRDAVDQRNPLQQRTFTIVRQARGFKVQDENSVRVPEGVAHLVLEEEGLSGFDYVRSGDRVARELAGRPLAVGTEIELGAETAHAFVEGRSGRGDMRLFVTPKGTRDEAGTLVQVFSTRLTIQTERALAGSDTAVEMRGEMRFSASTGRFLSIHLDGVLSVASMSRDDAHTIEVTGLGPWSIRETARYESTR